MIYGFGLSFLVLFVCLVARYLVSRSGNVNMSRPILLLLSFIYSSSQTHYLILLIACWNSEERERGKGGGEGIEISFVLVLAFNKGTPSLYYLTRCFPVFATRIIVLVKPHLLYGNVKKKKMQKQEGGDRLKSYFVELRITNSKVSRKNFSRRPV